MRMSVWAFGPLMLMVGSNGAGLPQGVAATAQTETGKAQWGSFGVNLASMDRSIHPGDDHWSYVNGTWEKQSQVPADRGALSQVSRLNDVAAAQVKVIIDDMSAKRPSLRGDDARVSDYFSALMDRPAIDARGAAPLLEDLTPIRAAATHAKLAGLMGGLVREWQGTPPVGAMPRYFPSLFAISIGQDDKNPDRYVPTLGQSGIGLPDRDYFLKTDDASAKTQEAYRAHIASMLRLSGVSAAEASVRAAAVYEFERKLAEAHWTLADSRDSDKTYNPWTLGDLKAKAPGFDWEAYLAGAGLAARPTFIVGQTSAISAMAKSFQAAPLPVLKD